MYVLGGRYVKELGPSILYNPSNPFVIETGRLNPKLEIEPMDFVEFNYSMGLSWEATLIGNIASNFFMEEDSFDTQTSKAFKRIIDQSELIYHKIPQYDKGIIGSGLNKKYLSSGRQSDTRCGKIFLQAVLPGFHRGCH